MVTNSTQIQNNLKTLGFIPANLAVESLAIQNNTYMVQVRVARDLVKAYCINIKDVAIAYDSYYRNIVTSLDKDPMNKTYLLNRKRITHRWRKNERDTRKN